MASRQPPQVVYEDGKPVAVILNIDVYREMLERLEDAEELEMLDEMRKRPLSFRSVDDFLAEYSPSA